MNVSLCGCEQVCTDVSVEGRRGHQISWRRSRRHWSCPVGAVNETQSIAHFDYGAVLQSLSRLQYSAEGLVGL